MYILIYTNLVRGNDKFFNLSEDRKILIRHANEITKHERYVIKWNKSKRGANVTIKGTPQIPIGRWKILKVKPL